MKILLYILLFLSLNATAQITYKGAIGASSATGNGVTTGTFNATVATSLNVLIVVHLSNNTASGALPSTSSSGVMGDSKGNIYILANSRSQGSFARSSTWYVTGPSTIADAAQAWTSTLSGSAPSIDVQVFYGYGTFSLDQNTNNGVTLATTGNTGSVTPTVANELMVTAMCDVSRTNTPTVTPGTITTFSTFSSGIKFSGAMAYEILSGGSGVPYSATYTFGGASLTAALQIVSFSFTPSVVANTSRWFSVLNSN